MTPLHTTCTTCRTRLKIRNRQAIGKILPCPRCGSMVLVQADDGLPADTTAATSPGNSKSSGDQPRWETAEETGGPTVPVDQADAVEESAEAPPKSSVPPDMAETRDDWEAVEPDRMAGEMAVPGPPPEIPSDREEAAPPGRSIMPLVAAATAGLLMAVLVFGAMWVAGRRDRVASDNERKQAGSRDLADASSNDPSSGRSSDEPNGDSQSPDAGGDETPGDSEGNDDGDAGENGSIEPGTEDPPDVPGEGDPRPGTDDGEENDVPPSDPVGPPGLEPDVDPSDADGGMDDEPPVDVVPTDPLPETLRDVEGLLAMPLAEIDFEAIPLAAFLRLMSDMTTVPITLDLEALMSIECDPEIPVQVQLTETTAGAALRSVLEPLGLASREQDGHLVVTAADPENAVRDEASFNLDALAPSDPLVHQHLLESFGLALAQHGADGESASLTIEDRELVLRAPPAALVEMTRVVERFQQRRRTCLTRGPQPTPWQTTAEALNTPITVTFFQPVRLHRVLDYLRQERDLRIYVDWQALSAAGWGPDHRVTLVCMDEPLRTALEELLASRNLAIRVVDHDLLQITSRRTLEQSPRLALHPVHDLLDAETTGEFLAERLRASLAVHDGTGGPDVEPSGREIRLYFDPEVRCLVAACSEADHRRLVDLLGHWREGSTH